MTPNIPIENELKQYILTKYKSIRAFTHAADIPYSTVDTMIKKGIGGTGINTVSKICKTLSIDLVSLSNGLIVPLDKKQTTCQPYTEVGEEKTDFDIRKRQVINNYDSLNDRGREKLLEYSNDLVSSGNYINDEESLNKKRA